MAPGGRPTGARPDGAAVPDHGVEPAGTAWSPAVRPAPPCHPQARAVRPSAAPPHRETLTRRPIVESRRPDRPGEPAIAIPSCGGALGWLGKESADVVGELLTDLRASPPGYPGSCLATIDIARGLHRDPGQNLLESRVQPDVSGHVIRHDAVLPGPAVTAANCRAAPWNVPRTSRHLLRTADARSGYPRVDERTVVIRVIIAHYFGPVCGDDHPYITRSARTRRPPGRPR